MCSTQHDEVSDTVSNRIMVSNPLLGQANLRAVLVPPLIAYIRSVLARLSPGVAYTVLLYGSLHHGLYVVGHSKVCIDIQAVNGAPDKHILHMLASAMQRETHPKVEHPVLIWHRTVQRPAMLMLFWHGSLVHVTHHNAPARAVSEFIWRTLAYEPRLHLTLLQWKTAIRLQPPPCLLGPNVGQVSTYALFAILLANLSELSAKGGSLACFTKAAKDYVVGYLAMVPRVMQTRDPLSSQINLTAHSHLAPELATLLQMMDACSGE